MKGTRRDRRGRGAVAQTADGLNDDAAGEHIEQGDDAQRRQALDLAVTVVVLGVGRPVREADDDPRHNGRE